MKYHTPRTKRLAEGYNEGYDDLPRFSSYLNQFNWVRRLNGQNILEIGKGNGTVSTYLRNLGHQVTTLDYDERLQPDINGDVRAMTIADRSYDIILCCEVLEHLHFKDFGPALLEMNRVTKKHVILSIPYSCLRVECALRLQDNILSGRFRIPTFFLKPRTGGEHYWEMGRRGFPKNRIRKAITNSGFKIIQEDSPVLNPWHYFFILEKKNG